MVKCSKAEVRRLKTALRWKIPAAQRQRMQMVLLRESYPPKGARSNGPIRAGAYGSPGEYQKTANDESPF